MSLRHFLVLYPLEIIYFIQYLKENFTIQILFLKIESLLEDLNLAYDTIYNNNGEINRFINERYQLAWDCLSHYQYLNVYVSNRLKGDYSTKVYHFDYEDVFSKTTFLKKDTLTINDSFHWLFVANIKLAELDEGYCVDEETIVLLSEIYHKLDKINISLETFISKTRYKCSILLYKIFRRLQKTDEKTQYSFFNDDNLTFEELEKNIPFEIIEKINIQYSEKENKEIYQKNIKINELFNSKTLTIESSHLFIKSVKRKIDYNEFEFKETVSSLENLKKFFLEKIAINDQNIIPFKTIYYLIINCKFKLECNQRLKSLGSKFDFENLKNCNNFIDNSYQSTLPNPNDYFPNCILSKIYIEKKIELIEIIYTNNPKELNNEKDDYFTLLQDLFKTSFEEINNLKYNIKICKNNKIMPLYLELDECHLSDNTFIDSQYILPSNYEYLSSECELYWDKLKLKENIFYSFTPKVIYEKLEKDIKDQQYSIITVIGLYASFITFILANVNVLPELMKYSVGAVLAFMLVFGIVLFFFVASLKLLFTSNAKELIKGKSNFLLWLIFGLLVAVMGVTSILIYINDDFKKEIKKTTITTFDLKTGKKQTETQTTESETKEHVSK